MWTAPATSPRASRWNEDLMNNVRRVAIAAAVVLLAPTAVTPGQAQGRDAASGIGLRATRAALEDRARRGEGGARSAALSRDARGSAAREAAAIRARLVAGDFAVGDRILLAVEGEKELSDTFTVGPGRLLPLPGIGDVPLEGVLRTELQAYLTRRLAQNLNDPVVRAQAFVRLSIQGEVTRPGYCGIPAEVLLSAACMTAGSVATGRCPVRLSGPCPCADRTRPWAGAPARRRASPRRSWIGSSRSAKPLCPKSSWCMVTSTRRPPPRSWRRNSASQSAMWRRGCAAPIARCRGGAIA